VSGDGFPAPATQEPTFGVFVCKLPRGGRDRLPTLEAIEVFRVEVNPTPHGGRIVSVFCHRVNHLVLTGILPVAEEAFP
jgi:hypothetical protein